MTARPRWIRFLAAGALCAAAAAAAPPARAEGNVGVVLGARSLSDDGVWKEGDPFDLDLSKQGVIGITADLGKPRWPVRVSVGFFQSRAKDEDSTRTRVSFPSTGPFQADVDLELEATLSELSFGVQKGWGRFSAVRPFVEGGLAMTRATLQTAVRIRGTSRVFKGSEDEQDTGIGFYLRAGVLWRLGSRFNLGVDARAVLGDKIEDSGLRPIDGNADCVQAGLVLGWGWP